MECPEGRRRRSSKKDLTPDSTSEVTSVRYSQTAGDHGAETAGGRGAQTAGHLGAQTDAAIGNQAAARTPVENLREGTGKWFLRFFPVRDQLIRVVWARILVI